MVDLTGVAIQFLRAYGLLALLLFTFLETSMLFPLLPSEIVVPAAAVLLISDPASFLAFLLAAAAGRTMGAFVPFYVFRGSRIGGDWLRERIDVSDEQLDYAREWFRKWGESSVLWGRFLPALRSVVSIPAGLAGMDPTWFGVFTAVGTVGFYAATGAVVYYGRQQPLVAAALDAAVERPALTAAGVLALLVIGILVERWRWRRRYR